MFEVQDIFNSVKPIGLLPVQRKAFFAIRNCRTDILGSHVDRCGSCDNIHISYNSCRNRVAISNSMIESFGGNSVTFRWKDYRDNNRVKFMTLEAAEFVRRFMLHVLPSGFTRIRHYGILSSRNTGTKLALCIKLAGVRPVVPEVVRHVNSCPLCGGVMAFAGVISSSSASP